jgi:low affinity Fe/Cu permease
MAKENRMTKEDYLAECAKVENTAYAEQGDPQVLLLQNINAFGVEIANLSTKVRALERSASDAELRIIGLEHEIALLSEEVENGKTNT